MSTRPPHPGPRPPDLVFPFAEAQQARSAALRLASRLRHVATVHEDGWDHVRARRFEGGAARRLEAQLGERLAEVHAVADALRRQADAIADDVAAAQRAVRARESEQLAWRRRRDAYDDWTPPAPRPAPAPSRSSPPPAAAPASPRSSPAPRPSSGGGGHRWQ